MRWCLPTVRSFPLLALAAVVTLWLSGCNSLSSMERLKIAEYQLRGLPVPHAEVKDPAVAGLLNLLPGFGNFYLAIGTDYNEHWFYGILNLLTWPYSTLWGIPEAAIDAGNINRKESLYYYEYGRGAKDTGIE